MKSVAHSHHAPSHSRRQHFVWDSLVRKENEYAPAKRLNISASASVTDGISTTKGGGTATAGLDARHNRLAVGLENAKLATVSRLPLTIQVA